MPFSNNACEIRGRIKTGTVSPDFSHNLICYDLKWSVNLEKNNITGQNFRKHSNSTSFFHLGRVQLHTLEFLSDTYYQWSLKNYLLTT